jgi:hypothetical protein
MNKTNQMNQINQFLAAILVDKYVSVRLGSSHHD